MRSLARSLIVAAAATLGCGCAFAQANPTTPVTATQLRASGVLINSGNVSMTLIDTRGTAQPFTTADGTYNQPQAFTGAIVNGVLAAGFAVPDQCTATAVTPNTPLSYLIIVSKTTAPASSSTFVVPAAAPAVCGSTAFALDHYSPTQTAPAFPSALGSGTVLPNGGRCIGSGYFYTYSGVVPVGDYVCIAGLLRLKTSSGGTTLVAGTDYLPPSVISGNIASAVATEAEARAAAVSASNATITAEVTRATNAETSNTTAISAEATRATAAEAGKMPNTSAAVALALGYTPAQSAAITGALASNVLADYQTFPGSGTTLPDSSGNHYDGTFVGLPVWGLNSLSLPVNAGVRLPVAVNATKSVVYAGCVPVVNAYSNYITLVSSGTGSPGFSLLANVPGNRLGQIGIWSSNAVTVAAQQQVGCHIWAAVYGTGGDGDHLYVDGVEQTYGPRGTTGVQSADYLAIGSSGVGPWSGGGLQGNFYRARFYSSRLSADDVLNITNLFRGYLANVGVVFGAPIPHPTPEIILSADSLGTDTGGSTGNTWMGNLALVNWPAYTPINLSIGGQKEHDLAPSNAVRIAPRCGSPLAPATVLINAGTNDMAEYGSASDFAAGLISSLALDARIIKAAGCRAFVGTLFDRKAGTSGEPSAFTGEAGKNAANAAIRAQYKALGFDGIFDGGAIPQMGADGAALNGTYFQDGLHHTDAGKALISAAVSNALNAANGSTEAGPTVVTSNSATLTAHDTYVSASPTANAVITLPSCIGQSGANYRINNSTAFQIRLQTALSAQTINGSDYSTTGMLTTGPGTVTLRDVPNPPSQSGCHWEM